jgi:hypothetical protein
MRCSEEETAAMDTTRLYLARLRRSKRPPYVIQRSLVRLVALVVGGAGVLVLLGVVSLHSLVELMRL